MAVAAAAVAMTTAVALTSGGNCGGRSVGEAESSKGGTVLHLQASGCGVGHGVVNEPTDEGTGEGEGGDRHRHRGFNGGGCGLQSPVEPNVVNDDNDINENNDNEGTVSRGGRDDK
jgi:hypothetical protein